MLLGLHPSSSTHPSNTPHSYPQLRLATSFPETWTGPGTSGSLVPFEERKPDLQKACQGQLPVNAVIKNLNIDLTGCVLGEGKGGGQISVNKENESALVFTFIRSRLCFYQCVGPLINMYIQRKTDA